MPLDPITKAKVGLQRVAPFFAVALTKFPLSTSTTIPTACVNVAGRITVNPDWFLGLAFRQQMFVLAHEAGHVVFDHLWRLHPDRGYDDKMRANIACDLVINDLLGEHRQLEALPGALKCPESLKGYPAETVYRKITTHEVTITGQRFDEHDVGGAEEGADDRGMSESERKDHQRKLVAESLGIARRLQQGDMPAGLMRHIDQILGPARANWRTVLARLGSSRTQARIPSWRRTGRRRPDLPGRRRELRPLLVIGTDTSGSIDEGDLRANLVDVRYVARHFTVTRYIACDAALQTSESDLSRFVWKIRGGGGTDFRPIFEEAEQFKPDVLLVFTDLLGTFPEVAPRFRTLWAVPGGISLVEVPFGRVVAL